MSDINPTQTINFPSAGDQIYGAGPITLLATPTSSVPIAYSVTGPANVFHHCLPGWQRQLRSRHTSDSNNDGLSQASDRQRSDC